jgi:hypothetical protein
MDMKSLGQVVGRVAMAAGLAMALSAYGMAAEDPPRPMYGTTAWSDAWQRTCGDLDSVVEPKQPGYEHLNNDCAQYEVAQQMRNQQPEVAANAQP